jgi:Ankyrin repeat.
VTFQTLFIINVHQALKLNNHLYLFQTYIINKEVEGRKYIHYASDYGQLDVLKYLIANGAHKDVS